jgi:toxin FitB
MFLLDTNVVSDLRRIRPHGAVLAWLNGLKPEDIRISAVTVAEMQAGIERTRDSDPERARELEVWLTSIEQSYMALPMDSQTFRLWAKLMVKRQMHLAEDAMIAATALHLDLIVATRNTRDFEIFGARVFNPFEYKA